MSEKLRVPKEESEVLKSPTRRKFLKGLLGATAIGMSGVAIQEGSDSYVEHQWQENEAKRKNLLETAEVFLAELTELSDDFSQIQPFRDVFSDGNIDGFAEWLSRTHLSGFPSIEKSRKRLSDSEVGIEVRNAIRTKVGRLNEYKNSLGDAVKKALESATRARMLLNDIAADRNPLSGKIAEAELLLKKQNMENYVRPVRFFRKSDSDETMVFDDAIVLTYQRLHIPGFYETGTVLDIKLRTYTEEEKSFKQDLEKMSSIRHELMMLISKEDHEKNSTQGLFRRYNGRLGTITHVGHTTVREIKPKTDQRSSGRSGSSRHATSSR